MSHLPPNFPLFINFQGCGHQKWTPNSAARIYHLVPEFPANVAHFLFCRGVHVFALCSPIMFPCSPRPQAARPSSSPASAADATCRPGGRNSLSSPSRSNAPSAVNSGSTGRARSSSAVQTSSSPASSGPDAGNVRPERWNAPAEPLPRLFWSVPHYRCPAGTGAVGECAGGAHRQGHRGVG